MTIMVQPDFQSFRELARSAGLIPVHTEILADTETPVRALMRFSGCSHVFLLESVEGGERWGRYSFLGFDPLQIWEVWGDEVRIKQGERSIRIPHGGDPLGILRGLLEKRKGAQVEGLPRFWGGAVGYLGYDMVRFMERVPFTPKPCLELPDASMMLTDSLLIFDNVRHTIRVVVTAQVEEGRSSLQEIYSDALQRIQSILRRLREPSEEPLPSPVIANGPPLAQPSSNMGKAAFLDAVGKAKEQILAGEAIQVVLSQRFQMEAQVDPVALYRALRFINPSPYLFFLKSGEVTLVGSSPELLVRLEGGSLDLRPIAGTRKRGGTQQEDRALADELLGDPKERAEHVMLVDLGRNDLGRVARTGTVQLREFTAVERYSHVMHLVSHIQAELAQGKDALDVLRATFPAGTLTGAPKVRAMEIIEEMEPTRRGPYGGAVGYLSYTGNMDLCITIRTLLLHGSQIYVQAGAGIVADSDPAKEYEETCNKARGMWEAVRMAASGLEVFEASGNGQTTQASEHLMAEAGGNPCS
jgi:anthranilate synthase component 1